MNTLKYITNKYNLDLTLPSPIEIPDMGRDNLGELFRELGLTKGLEMGTERGLFAEVLCKANPKLKLTCVDAWSRYEGYREHVTEELLDEIYLDAQRRLSPFKCNLVKAFSVDAAKTFPDESLDFIYIDGNHEYKFVAEDLNAWYKKIRLGGIIAGHDYISRRGMNFGVIEAVKEFTKANNVNPWFVIGTKDKIPGQIRDNTRSYMWVKQ
jgi:hypothetical protein